MSEQNKVNKKERDKMSITKGWTPANSIQMCLIIFAIIVAYVKANEKIEVHSSRWEEQTKVNDKILSTLESHDERMDQDDIDDAVEKQISLGMAEDISRVRVLFEELMKEKKEL